MKEAQHITRRKFILFLSGAVTASAFGINLANSDTDKADENDSRPERIGQRIETISLNFEKWSNEDILSNPAGFLQEVGTFLAKIDPEVLGQTRQTFLDHFCPECSPNPEQASENLNILNHAYVELGFGQRSLSFLNRAEELGVKDKFNSISPWWSAFFDLNSALAGENLAQDPFNIGPAVLSLIDLVIWCEPLSARDDYKEQKQIYVQQGKQEIQDSNFDEIMAETWKTLALSPRADVYEEFKRSKLDYEAFSKIVSLVKDHFPLAFYKLQYFDLTQKKRAYYRQDLSGAFLDEVFFYMTEGLEDGDEWFSTLWANFTLIEIFHELSHNFDPYLVNKFSFAALHPEDFFTYNEQHLEMYEDFYQVFDSDSFGADEIEQFILDPLSPRTFGIDWIQKEVHMDSFNREIDSMIEVCRFLDNLENDDLLWVSNMRSLFSGDPLQNKIWSWALSMNDFSTEQNSDVPILENVFTKISSFNQISVSHLQEIKQLTNEVFKSPSSIARVGDEFVSKDGLLSTLLKIKSAYLLIFYRLLRKGLIEGLIEPESQMSDIYQNLQFMINSHLMHCMNGPVGEYLPYPLVELDLLAGGEQKVAEAFENAALLRQHASSIYTIYWLPEIIKMSENLLTWQAKLRNQRAVLWGADTSSLNPSIEDSYTQMTKNLLNFFGFSSEGAVS